MNRTTLLLFVSLAANAAVAIAWFNRPVRSTSPAPREGRVANNHGGGGGTLPETLRAALATGDQRTLEAAGLSPDLARDIVLARPFARFAGSVRVMQSRTPEDPRWWRRRNSPTETREEDVRIHRELSDAMLAAFGDDFDFSDSGKLSFLSPEKRAAVRRVTLDYDEMEARFSGAVPQLASDREKLRLLRAERDRDVAALLTPAERAEYEMRQSPAAQRLIERFGNAIESEDDLRTLYVLQKAHDAKFPAEELNGQVSMDALRARAAADRQLHEDMRAAVGDERYTAMRRAADQDLGWVDELVTRLKLPANTVDRVAATRESLAAASQRINSDVSLTPVQRTAQFEALDRRARAELADALGNEAADAYSQTSSWLMYLNNGTAFSTTPPENYPRVATIGTESVYPVSPPPRGGGGRVVRDGVAAGVAPAPTAPAPAASPVPIVSPSPAPSR